jgi:hypothetical protein
LEAGIAIHALENLAHSDTGIVMLRRLLREQLKRVEQGLDPINVMRDASANKRTLYRAPSRRLVKWATKASVAIMVRISASIGNRWPEYARQRSMQPERAQGRLRPARSCCAWKLT